MHTAVAERLSTLVQEGGEATNSYEIERWSQKVYAFLRIAASPIEAVEFKKLKHDDEWQEHALRLGHVQGLIAKAEAGGAQLQRVQVEAGPQNMSSIISLEHGTRRVFIVHGHDNEAKEGAARFLEKLGLQPVILHEQANAGRTVIEKFEQYSGDVAFAVILLTPDDVGGAVGNQDKLNARARQNVILELGYFMGRLGRSRVCALYKGGVELPSDYQGVAYVEMDASGAWRTKLAQEFVQAKLPIELTGLVGG